MKNDFSINSSKASVKQEKFYQLLMRKDGVKYSNIIQNRIQRYPKNSMPES